MRSAVLILATLGLSASVALAADKPDKPANGGTRVACKADVEKLCSTVQPGQGRIIACLKQNEAQVSASCKDAIANARQQATTPGMSSSQGSPQSTPQGSAKSSPPQK